MIVLPLFFDRLDVLLPSERGPDGMPSTADFVLHELTHVVEALADDFIGATSPLPDSDTRVLVATGLLVGAMAIYVRENSRGAVEVLWLDLGP